VSDARRNFLVVWIANFVTATGMMSFLPLIPLYLGDLGVTAPGAVRTWSGVLIAAAPLPAALMGPIWGALGDRVGRKLMIVRAQVAIAVFVGCMGLVESPWQLLALRLGQGAAPQTAVLVAGRVSHQAADQRHAVVARPQAMTLVSVTAPEHRQARVASLLQMAVMAGAVTGPLIGGLIGDAFGYRAAFAVCAALSLTSLLMVVVWVREPPGRAPREGGLEVLELLREVLRDVGRLLRAPALRAVLLAAFAVRFGASLVEPILALYVDTLTGFDPARLATVTGAVFGVHAVATLLLTPVWGRIGDRHGHRLTLVACAAGAGVSYVAQAAVTDVVPLLALRFVAGAFVAGVVPAAFAAASDHSTAEQRGGAYGFTFSSVILARALAPLAGGWLAAVVGLEFLFVVAAVMMLGAALVYSPMILTSTRLRRRPSNSP